MSPSRRNSGNSLPDGGLQAAIDAIEQLKQKDPTDYYANVRQGRERATFTLMLKMDPIALQAIRKEWYVREDEVALEEFIYIIDKHLLKASDTSSLSYKERRDFGSNMYEIFKEVDVNGDGHMEWEELTKFIIEKANQLNKSIKLASISKYQDTSEFLDTAAQTRHRNEYSQLYPIRHMNHFAALEDHCSAVHIFNGINGRYVSQIKTPSTPQAVTTIPERNLLACACADATIVTCSTDDPVPAKRYQVIICPSHLFVGSKSVSRKINAMYIFSIFRKLEVFPQLQLRCLLAGCQQTK